jgi:hypothetical protein
MPFFSFRQNNSGGSFDTDSKVCQFIFIEAKDSDKADRIATDLGIYFNGVDEGQDCSCCGDRWHPADYPEDEETLGGQAYSVGQLENLKAVIPDLKYTVDQSKYGDKYDFKLKSISELARYYAVCYGFDTKGKGPKARIYYANGDVEAID